MGGKRKGKSLNDVRDEVDQEEKVLHDPAIVIINLDDSGSMGYNGSKPMTATSDFGKARKGC